MPLGLIVSRLPLPSPDADMIRTNAARMAPLHTHPWLLALHAGIIAPHWEECVYRGFILQMLRRYVERLGRNASHDVPIATTLDAVAASLVALIAGGRALRSESSQRRPSF